MSQKLYMRGLIVLNVMLLAAVLLFLGHEGLRAQSQPLAETPQLISYQGVLTDDAGNPIDGSHNLTVAIFAADEGGEPLWQETHTGANFDGGAFSILLGSVTALPEDLFDASERWLEVTVDDTTLTPRQQFSSVPYALNADKIDGLDSAELAALPSGTVVDLPTTTSPTGFSPIEGAMGEDIGGWLALPEMPEGQEGVLCDTYGAGRVFCWNAETGVSPVGVYYDDAQNTWRTMSTAGAPSAREGRVAVWAGNRFIVWGGHNGSTYLDSGARYNPDTNTWAPTNATGAPEARRGHAAVSLGNRIMVWGGFTGTLDYGERGVVNSGAIYDPIADAWQPVSTEGAPSPRHSPGLVWTGSRVIVWGGLDGFSTHTQDGAIYDPATDTWSPISPPPAGGQSASITWTGAEMLLPSVNFGWLLYEPNNDAWRLMPVPSTIRSSLGLLAADDLWLNANGGYGVASGRFFFVHKDVIWGAKTTFWTGERILSFPEDTSPYFEGSMRSHTVRIVYPHVKE